MVKGVNKTIIEINETRNQIFDRVLLFVNPDKAYSDSAVLKKEAFHNKVRQTAKMER